MAYLQKGYLCVSNKNGKVREGGAVHYPLHRLIYEEAHGVVLPVDIVVHHVNEDPLDNRIENLEAVKREEHPKRHRRASRPGERRCGVCGQWKALAEFFKRQKRCKDCAKEARAAWLAARPEKVDEYNRRRRERYAAAGRP